MSNTMFFNLLLNIGLLVLIATMLTKLPMVRSMLLEDSHAMGSRAALAVIFGLVSIFSTYTGAVSYTHLDVYKRQVFHLKGDGRGRPGCHPYGKASS